jgi:signal transduction histidine kinase
VLAALLVAFVLPVRTRTRAWRLGVACSAAVLIAIGGAIVLAVTGLAIPFVSLLLVLTIAAVAVEAVSMTASLRESHVALVDQREHDLESKRLLAHELKTPIASMRNLTQLLAGFDLSAAERQRVAVLLQSEAGKLETMVQALLDLERLSLRDFAAASAVTDLGDVVRARVDVLQASAGHRLQVSIARGVLVRGDSMLLERVTDNLVSNALKYTSGIVTVTVRAERGEALLEVADRGAGIAAVDRERLFQRFYRGASARGTEGLGLGLAFVAEVAKWHGGRVTVDNLPEGGACFRFALPAESEGA